MRRQRVFYPPAVAAPSRDQILLGTARLEERQTFRGEGLLLVTSFYLGGFVILITYMYVTEHRPPREVLIIT